MDERTSGSVDRRAGACSSLPAALLRLLGIVAAAVAWSGLLCAGEPHAGAASRRTENLVLVTLDGVRGREIFGGLDLDTLRASIGSGKKPGETAAYRRFWAATPRQRRLRLMPFFWGELMARHGSIAGDRALGSVVRLANRHRFSYPGYAELLTGRARDDLVASNDRVRNPTTTVLELLRERLGVDRARVACFASWDVFPWIVCRSEGAITCNAGYAPYPHGGPLIRELSRLQLETRTPWDSVRHDAYTFRFAMAHLERFEPRVLYIAFGETDDWAHDGRYDRVLEALERSDRFLRELWEALESRPRYRGKTTIVITTDHGRGETAGDWTDHGAEVEGAQYTWIAFISPDSPRRGEWRGGEEIRAEQVAATLCRFLGIDPAALGAGAAPPIEAVFGE